MRAAALVAIAVLVAAPAAAQKFGGGFRPSPAPYRAPVPTYRAPAPAPVYRAPTPVSRPAPVTRPAPAQTRTVRPEVAVRRASAPAAKPLASTPRTKAPVVDARGARGTVTSGAKREVSATRSASAPNRGIRRPRSLRIRGSSYAWTAPAIVPIWWMSTMNQPYDYGSYDAFIERCLRSEPDERSDECVRALRERGLAD